MQSEFGLSCLFGLNQTNRIEPDRPDEPDKPEGYDCTIQNGLDTSTEVPSPGSKEPSCRLRVMPVMVSPPSGAKTDQRDETSAEQHTTSGNGTALIHLCIETHRSPLLLILCGLCCLHGAPVLPPQGLAYSILDLCIETQLSPFAPDPSGQCCLPGAPVLPSPPTRNWRIRYLFD